MDTIRRISHPRPDRVRKNWKTLNGPWRFRFDRNDEGRTVLSLAALSC